MGFNVETVTYKKIKFSVWVSWTLFAACSDVGKDVGGQDKIRPLWRHYYTGTSGLIFVIDAADHDRIEEAKQELRRITADREMRDVTLLVFANKQDIPNALTPDELEERLELKKLPEFKDRLWSVFPSCATTGDGLYEGLGWMGAKGKSNKAPAARRR